MNEDVTAHAAELAERILDEVSRADQDWCKVAHWAAILAELANRAATSPIDGDDAAPPP